LNPSTVLIVTNERDVGADFLVRELERRGVSVVRLNSERAPDWRLSLDPATGWRLSRGPRALAADNCAGVWWRRPELPSLPEGAPAEAVADQWRAFLAALAVSPGPVWVSEPARIRVAENKALQLRAARETGLDVPITLWSNDIVAARDFIGSCDGVAAVKSVTSAWWDEPDGASFVYASLITAEDLPRVERLAQAPVCFQQAITPKRDVRVTVVEDTVLAAIRLVTEDDADDQFDWRRGEHRPWVAYELPSHVREGCRKLVLSLGLRFGAIDLALDREERLWFLELNPNGEWGWLQRIGLPIAEALADTLTEEAASR
jgi:hypothetical protein